MQYFQIFLNIWTWKYNDVKSNTKLDQSCRRAELTESMEAEEAEKGLVILFCCEKLNIEMIRQSVCVCVCLFFFGGGNTEIIEKYVNV